MGFGKRFGLFEKGLDADSFKTFPARALFGFLKNQKTLKKTKTFSKKDDRDFVSL